MAIHDWSRVSAGVFHDFYLGWIVQLQRVLNTGILPRGYYAMLERVEPLEGESETEDEGRLEIPSYIVNVDNFSNVAMSEAALMLLQRRIVLRDDVKDIPLAILEIAWVRWMKDTTCW
jgi:hypothetical protein